MNTKEKAFTEAFDRTLKGVRFAKCQAIRSFFEAAKCPQPRATFEAHREESAHPVEHYPIARCGMLKTRVTQVVQHG